MWLVGVNYIIILLRSQSTMAIHASSDIATEKSVPV